MHSLGSPLVERWRGDVLECLHMGHAVICDGNGDIMESWGDPQAVFYPRSSCKMIQALPLVESGAADAYNLNDAHLALACASHDGAPVHTDKVSRWLSDLGLGEPDLLCGPQTVRERETRHQMIRNSETPCQIHNTCSGKHAGFLTLGKHIGAGADYVALDHPVQQAFKRTFEEVTQHNILGTGIDGCSAPNFATTTHALARAMASFAAARDAGSSRERAAARLTRAMRSYPELVAGEGSPCTELARATGGQAVLKFGADGVYIAILPERKIGIALKITDGSETASQCAIAALLVRLGVLAYDHPITHRWLDVPILSRRGLLAGEIRAANALR